MSEFLSVEVGLDCHKITEEIDLIYKITNLHGNVIKFSKSQVNFNLDMPDVFKINPAGKKGNLLRYFGNVHISTGSKIERSSFDLFSGEHFYVRNPISRYYDFGEEEAYFVTTYFSFEVSRNDLKSKSLYYDGGLKFGFSRDCFSDESVGWIDGNEIVEFGNRLLLIDREKE